MSIHGGKVIILEWTTNDQLEVIKKKLDKMSQDAWKEHGDNIFEMSQEDERSILTNGLQNLCCDLEVDGYEMS